MSIGVIGAGKWGSALAYAMSEKNDVVVTSRTPRELDNFVSLQEILKCEYLIITVPAQQVSQWLEENFIFSGQKILVASKGIEASSVDITGNPYENASNRDNRNASFGYLVEKIKILAFSNQVS